MSPALSVAFLVVLALPLGILAVAHHGPQHRAALQLAILGAAIGFTAAGTIVLLAPVPASNMPLVVGAFCGAMAGILGGSEADSLARAPRRIGR